MKTTLECLKELREVRDLLYIKNRIIGDDFVTLGNLIDDFENSLNRSERQPVTDNKGNGSKCVNKYETVPHKRGGSVSVCQNCGHSIVAFM